MVKKLKHQFVDEHLFRQEMTDVVPLKPLTTTDSKIPRKPIRKRTADHESVNSDELFPAVSDEHLHNDADDGSSHRKHGVQKRIIQKLKRGQFKVTEQLDLHSMTTETAHRMLLDFIQQTQGSGHVCIRVIHGKGLRSESGPKLKLMTQQVLREHSRVLAFTECKPADGGAGATDILLKSK